MMSVSPPDHPADRKEPPPEHAGQKAAPPQHPQTPEKAPPPEEQSTQKEARPEHAAPDEEMGKERASELYRWADDLETKLNVASENGLFKHQSEIQHKDILEKLTAVFAASLTPNLPPEAYAEARQNLDAAEHLYDTAIEAIGLRRRLSYVYGIIPLAYLLVVLGLIAWVLLWPPSFLSNALLFLTIPKKILLAGAVGAILRGVWSLWMDVDKKQYRKFWGTWFLLCPFMGGLLGGMVYLAFFVGIAVTTLSINFANPSLAILIAVLAGYNWEWAQGVLKRVIEVLQEKREE